MRLTLCSTNAALASQCSAISSCGRSRLGFIFATTSMS